MTTTTMEDQNATSEKTENKAEDQNGTSSEKIEKKAANKKKGWVSNLLFKLEKKLRGLKGKTQEKMSTATGRKLKRSRSGIEFGVDPNREEMRHMGEIPPANWISGKTFKRTYLVPECPLRNGLAL